MKLPLLISVPHGGLMVPQEVDDICQLTPEQVLVDSDEGAAEIYFGLEEVAGAFCSADVARAIVDLNRAADDFRKDGVIKTHTCYDIPVYSSFPSQEIIKELLNKYYRPYHQRLEQLAQQGNIKVGIDCHTMAAVGPPVGPDPGKKRPLVCISNGEGTCPDEWVQVLAACFRDVFPAEQIKVNEPFRGGFIIRNHSGKMPWLQIELSRAACPGNSEKSSGVKEALSCWYSLTFK